MRTHPQPLRLRYTGVLVFAVACAPVEQAAVAVGELPVARFALTGGVLEGPDTLPAGPTTVFLAVDGGPLDQISLVRFNAGHTVQEFLSTTEVLGFPPPWALFTGGPTGALPGVPARAVVGLTPGFWLALAFDAGPDGFPRVRPRAYQPFTVVQGGLIGRLPAAGISLQIFDRGFLLSSPLIPGTVGIDVANKSPHRHETILARLFPGYTERDMAVWLLARRRGETVGEAPGEVVAGSAALSQHMSNRWTVTLYQGRYALLCLLADDGDGRSHFDHGHLQALDVADPRGGVRPDSG